jgi:anti-sigma B factor antagonist
VSLFEIDVVAAADGVLRLEVGGEIDVSSAPGLLDSVLCAALASDHRQVVVDLRDVAFIDSCGLGALIEMHRRLGDSGAHLVIVRPSGLVRRLFEMTGLDSMLDLRPDWSDGHTALAGS